MAPTWAKKFGLKLKSTRRGLTPEPASTPPSTSSQTTPHLASQPAPPASSDTNLSSLGLQERLWYKAYENLERSEAEKVETYEKILSDELCKGNSNPTVPKSGGKQTIEARSAQMKQLVQAGLKRTQKAANIKDHISGGLDVVDVLKGIMDQAVTASTTASVAWVGICLGLEILSNPIKEPSINRGGITYVMSRMNWYWDLAGLLLDENRADTSSDALRGRLEEHVIELYQKLLLFQIKSVCLYYQNQAAVLVRDIFKFDDWDSQLQDIKDAESAVQKDSEQYNSEQVKSHLQSLAATAQSQETRLGSIALAIQDNTKQQEKRYKDEKDEKCLKDLYITDPREDKKRIEDTKGGLLRDSYRWILDHPDFRQFRDDPQNRLLWIKGDPGKGKTMLLCGIIDELEKESANRLSYFFCQATEVQLSNASAVLRGLIFLLVTQQPWLISYIRAKYDIAGEKLFESLNVWVSLTQILTDMLKGPNLEDVVLVIDALDECNTNREQLLDFIAKATSIKCRAKWIVSSRNWPNIEEQLAAAQNISVQLELNADSVSNAVNTFIEYKVDQLTRDKKYDDKTKAIVQGHLISNADGTFLWVALVCQILADPKVRKRHIPDKLKSFPPKLDALYNRMLENIYHSEDADVCKEILAMVSIVYRPITLEELKVSVQSLEDLEEDDLGEIIGACGSFLTLRDGVVFFVHQSAKDYLLNKASDQILPSGIAHQHYSIFSKSLDILSRTLRRDIYDLCIPGFLIEEVLPPNPDPLASVRYSCIYWVDHLNDSDPTQRREYNDVLWDNGTVHYFLQKSYLHWLEALSLLQSISEGTTAVQKLGSLLAENTSSEQLRELVKDAHRFILSHRRAVEIAPLQVYASALVFTPTDSLIRKLFKGEEPNWFISKPRMESNWGACLFTLEGHDLPIRRVAFSPDGRRAVSVSCSCVFRNTIINVWDTSTGACLSTFHDNRYILGCAGFLPNDYQVVLVSSDGIIKIWDMTTGGVASMSKLESSTQIISVNFSKDGRCVTFTLFDNTVRIWDSTKGLYVSKLEGHSEHIRSVASSTYGQRVITGSRDRTCKFWDMNTGACLLTLSHGKKVLSVDLSMDGHRAVSASWDHTVKAWNTTTGACIWTIQDNNERVIEIALSMDGQHVGTGSKDSIIKIWDTMTGVCISTLKGHNDEISSMTFSSDGRRIVSGSRDSTVKLWDVSLGMSASNVESYHSQVTSLALSTNDQYAVAGSIDGSITVWNTSTGLCIATLEGHASRIHSAVFSAGGEHVASASEDGTTKIWEVATGTCILTLCDKYDDEDVESEDDDDDEDEYISDPESDDTGTGVVSVVFSGDGQRVASGFKEGLIKVWDVTTGICTLTIQRDELPVYSLAFSLDGQWIASSLQGGSIDIIDVVTNECQSIFEDYENNIYSLAFSADGKQLASSSKDSVDIWDVATCACLMTLEVDMPMDRLSFDSTTNSRLSTSAGALDWDIHSVVADQQATEPFSTPFTRRGYGISPDGTWILKDENRMLWLPAEYRGDRTDVVGSTVAIGCNSNRVMVMQFSE